MTPSELKLLHELFQAGRELDAAARAQMLRQRCPDEALRREIEEMLADAQGLAPVAPGADPLGARAAPADPPEPWPRSGDLIGPYRLVERIGEGGFGEVWLAERREPMVQRVAIKIIKAGMDSRALIARFEQERQALAVMDHPNVARVLDAGTTERGRPYFVMEYVAGQPITRFCDDNRLTIRQRLTLFLAVCEAVQHAHQKGIIHRDIKPSNILVGFVDTRSGPGDGGHDVDGPPALVKVIDFGVAKATTGLFTDKTIVTETGQLVGTLEYMSPEQAGARGAGGDIDTRSDVYSLGAVLYELLSGRVPLDSGALRSATYEEMQRLIREVDPPKPSTRISGGRDDAATAIAAARRAEQNSLALELRRELDWIPLKALRKNRAERYGSAADLARDIRNYLDGRPLEAGPESTAYRLRKLVNRNRGLCAAGAAVGLSLVIGAAGFAWQAQRARRERDRALAAEADARRQAEDVRKVSEFHAAILSQINPTDAGRLLTDDVTTRLQSALAKAGASGSDEADQVRTFTSLWARVNPTDAARNLIERTILTPSVEAIGREFPGQPLIDARLRHVLGVQYETLGMYAPAQALLERTLEIRRRELGESDPETLRTLNELGTVFILQDRFDAAESLIRSALESRRRLLGNSHKDTIESVYSLGFLLNAQRKFGEAEPLIREALASRRAALGDDHRETLLSLNSLATCLDAQGRLDEAVALTRELLDRRRRVLGELHPETLNAINNLGSLLKSQGKLAEAEPYYREGLEKCRRVMGEEHPDTLISIHNMGFLLFRAGRYAEAEPFWRECLEKRRRVLGEDHPRTIISIGSLAVLLKAQGRPAEAEPLARDAVERAIRVRGEDHADTVYNRASLAEILAAQGKHAEAADLLASAATAADARLPPNDPRRKPLLAGLAKVYTSWDAAEPGRGHAQKAAEWKARLDAIDSAATAPAR